MKDEMLLEFNNEVKNLDSKDASYVNGFVIGFKILGRQYEDDGTPLQKAFIEHLSEKVKHIHSVKSEHGRFKHIVK